MRYTNVQNEHVGMEEDIELSWVPWKTHSTANNFINFDVFSTKKNKQFEFGNGWLIQLLSAIIAAE